MTLKESIALGVIQHVREYLLEDGIIDHWCNGETCEEWRGKKVEFACKAAFRAVEKEMEEWRKTP